MTQTASKLFCSHQDSATRFVFLTGPALCSSVHEAFNLLVSQAIHVENQNVDIDRKNKMKKILK